jgi:hypothetical protein
VAAWVVVTVAGAAMARVEMAMVVGEVAS